jgi:glyoxylase-like metal-dependent hydrolase (beta-lactamase superfamily II)
MTRTSDEGVRSGPLSPYLRLVLAPNPGPMTLDGTNTWIVGDPGRAAPVVVDPGPLDPAHLEAVLQACGGRVADIILTHRHHDHSDGAARLAQLAGCGVRAADPAFQVGPRSLTTQDRFEAAGASMTAHATPGHTSDSFSLLLVGEDGVNRLITGDMVLGRGTTVITRPDGNLGDYLRSLGLFEELVQSAGVRQILPGHGPVVEAAAELLAFYRAHRLERLEQVRQAWAAGDRTPAAIVARVYAEVDESVWPAAEQSVAAQLDYLQRSDSP